MEGATPARSIVDVKNMCSALLLINKDAAPQTAYVGTIGLARSNQIRRAEVMNRLSAACSPRV